ARGFGQNSFSTAVEIEITRRCGPERQYARACRACYCAQAAHRGSCHAHVSHTCRALDPAGNESLARESPQTARADLTAVVGQRFGVGRFRGYQIALPSAKQWCFAAGADSNAGDSDAEQFERKGPSVIEQREIQDTGTTASPPLPT